MRGILKTAGFLLILWFLLRSISGIEEGKEELELPEGTVYLYSQKEEFDSQLSEADHLAVFDGKGSPIFEMEAPAYIENVMLPEGTLLGKWTGLIPSDALLFITTPYRLSGSKEREAGVWDTATRSWILEMAAGMFSFREEAGKLSSFAKGAESYDAGFHLIQKEEQDFFEIGGQTFYNASDALGKNYIARADGSCFLNLEDFLLKNGLMEAPLPQDGLELFQTIGEQYLIVGGSYNDSTILDDTSTYRELRYLCDVNGNLLYRNWNRSGIGYARDQYGNLDKRYLEFSDDGGKPSQFLDLETGEEITVPEGWSDLQYKKDGLFLLENQQDYCIYDASDHSQGLSFRTKLFRDRIFLFGKRSYAIQSRSGAQYNQLVLERREVDLGTDTEFLAIIPGENPVILEGGQDGACTVSYILDAEGKLLYQGDGNVRGADGPYYLEQDGTEYRISMNGK